MVTNWRVSEADNLIDNRNIIYTVQKGQEDARVPKTQKYGMGSWKVKRTSRRPLIKIWMNNWNSGQKNIDNLDEKILTEAIETACDKTFSKKRMRGTGNRYIGGRM